MKRMDLRTLSDRVYDNLKQLITSRKLKPGQKLTLENLAGRLGVSRMPVLEALIRLESDGLLERRNRVGTYVTPLTQSLFKELYEARLMIEDWAADRIVARLAEKDLEKMRTILAKAAAVLQQAGPGRFDHHKFRHFDQQFHLSLIGLCGNSRIVECYEALNTHAQIGRIYTLAFLNRSKEVQREHEAILKAYAARDVRAARRAQRIHLETSQAGVVAMLKQQEML